MTLTHPIPPMTHELSRGWRQPAREQIVVFNDYAFMTRETWDAMPRYDASTPTGAYEGKMWRCQRWLCWYTMSPRSMDMVMRELREAVIVDNIRVLTLLGRAMTDWPTWLAWLESIGVDPTVYPSGDVETMAAWEELQ